jgi:hypothetical protein
VEDAVVGGPDGAVWLHGRQDGTGFAPPQRITDLTLSSVALADLDRDGRLDLVAGDPMGEVVVLLQEPPP